MILSNIKMIIIQLGFFALKIVLIVIVAAIFILFIPFTVFSSELLYKMIAEIDNGKF